MPATSRQILHQLNAMKHEGLMPVIYFPDQKEREVPSCKPEREPSENSKPNPRKIASYSSVRDSLQETSGYIAVKEVKIEAARLNLSAKLHYEQEVGMVWKYPDHSVIKATRKAIREEKRKTEQRHQRLIDQCHGMTELRLAKIIVKKMLATRDNQSLLVVIQSNTVRITRKEK